MFRLPAGLNLSAWCGTATPLRRLYGGRGSCCCAAKGWARWRWRYRDKGIAGLIRDATRPSRKKPLSAATIGKVADMTLHNKPANASHWSLRSMAAAAGISRTAVQRIWKAHGLKPHLTRTFKLSRDPKFNEKLADVVGLYLDPPDKALVLSVDEKSQIQALERTQKSLPMKPGQPVTKSHDCKRNGTTTLFAALDAATGKVIGQCMPRHRAWEFIVFLEKIDAETPPDLALHLIADNYATHKTEDVKAWLARHPRFHLHFTPTSSSWLNLVERFFAEISANSITRGEFKSIASLESAIMTYLENRNQIPTPFVWTAKPDKILEKIARAKHVLESGH
jgi:transposase/transcriptional regulator with XRE-family HTH domain